MYNPDLKEVIWCKEQGDPYLPSREELRLESPDPDKAAILKYLQAGDLHDDLYYWDKNLIRCFEEYNIPIPEKFREHILGNYDKRNRRLLELRFIKKVTVDVYPFGTVHYHIELNRNGDILYQLPWTPKEVRTSHAIYSFNDSVLKRTEELFLYDSGFQGTEAEAGFHWKISFYNGKGLCYRTEGWPSEVPWRREIFYEFLSELEWEMGEQFGAQYLKLQRMDAKAALTVSNCPTIPLRGAEYKSLAEIADKLLYGAAKAKPKDNILLSSVSIEILLAILSNAAAGDSLEELKSFSGFDAPVFWRLASILNKGLMLEKHNVSVANGLFINKIFRMNINNGFIRAIEKDFDLVRFHSDDPVGEINAWVREKTKKMIPFLVQDYSRLGDVAIFNAVSFEAKWRQSYDAQDVKDGVFFNLFHHPENVTMLHSTEKQLIVDELATGFIKPYKESEFSFMALLPQQTRDPLEMLCAMKPGKLLELYSSAIAAEVEAAMPEFCIDSAISIKDVLAAYGVASIFDPYRADISNLISAAYSHVSDIVHRAHIEVDRSGTRAAAATMAALAAGCAPVSDKFKVILNRPFVFAIIHNRSGLPLFQGIINTVSA